MTNLRLIGRSLAHFRRSNLASALGVAVAATVLTGALVIGDSIRLSLTDLAEARLGPVRAALTGERFFPADLARRLDGPAGPAGREVLGPAILLSGAAADAAQIRRAGGVQVGALPESLLSVRHGRCVINQALAKALGATSGQDILLTVARADASPADAVLARRGRDDRLGRLRLTVDRVVEGPSPAADFSLHPTQRPAPRAWARLAELARAAGAPGSANVIFFGDSSGDAPAWRAPAPDPQAGAGALPGVTLRDVGLSLGQAGQDVVLACDGIYLPVAAQAAAAPELTVNRVLAHLANRVERVDPTGGAGAGRAIYYAVVAGLSDPPGGPLSDDEVALNDWAADRLGARVGDLLVLTFFVRLADGTLVESTSSPLRVARVVPMTGLGADPTLAPEVPGLTDAASVAEWRLPAEWKIDRRLITGADEDYWREHKAAPKLFLSLALARRLWADQPDRLTSLRLAGAAPVDLERRILGRLDLPGMGLRMRELRAEQLAAARGNTDFAGLLLGLSLLLVLAGLLLAGLLLRLSAERRAGQHGLLLAVGFAPAAVRRLALAEGLAISVTGVLVGLVGAVGYTAGILAALRTWWRPAVGTEALSAHVQPATLVVGGAISLAAALLAVGWGVWRVGRTSAAALLAGGRALEPALALEARRRGRLLPAVLAVLPAVALLSAPAVGLLSAQWAYLAGGAALLGAMLVWLGLLLRPRRPGSPRLTGGAGLIRLALQNTRRCRSRSLLTAALLGLASFILTTAAAFRFGPPDDVRAPSSGAGGFALLGRADIPLPASPAGRAGRRLLGIPRDADAILDRARIVALPGRAGDDLSCLNLHRPTHPAVLGVEPAALAGRFRFARTAPAVADPWTLLEAPLDDSALPVIADDDTARHVLHVRPGEVFTVPDSAGRPRTLRLSATLSSSIFQGELLVSPASLTELYPDLGRGGFARLLIEVDVADEPAVSRVLSESLGDYGLTVESSSALLARLAEVANAYLSAFTALGALGLLLGTAGLGVVLVGNLIQRRAELALLAALGFGPARRLALVLIEHGWLLLAGLGGGLSAALAGIIPAGRGGDIRPGRLGLALTLILLTGLLVLVLAAWRPARRVFPAELAREA